MRAAEATALIRRRVRCHRALMPMRVLGYALVLCAALSTRPTGASAQTPTSGMVRGVVRDEAGLAVSNARVVVEEVVTGFTRAARTDVNGRFEFRLLAHGEYTAFAEKLGYRPQMLTDVHLRPWRSVELELTMAEAEPPVMTIDSVVYGGNRTGWSEAGAVRWFGDVELSAPRSASSVLELQQLSSTVDVDGGVEGLPSWFTRYGAEGFAFAPLGAPGPAPLRNAQSVSSLAHAELANSVATLDAAGSAGSRLFGYGRSGTRDFAVRAWGQASDPAIPLGRFSDDIGGAFDKGRAGLEVAGPIIRDTAVFRLGGEWRSTARALPRAFRLDDLAGATVLAAARDSADRSLLALTLPYVEDRQEIAGWGRFAWRIAADHDLSAFADVSLGAAAEDVDPLRAAPLYGGAGEWLEATAGASLRSTLSRRFSNELRAALVRSTRDELLPGGGDLRSFADTGIPPTRIANADLLLGADPYAPFSVARTGVQVQQALLISLGSHLLEVGFAGEWDGRDHTLAAGRAGSFAFGSADQLLAGTGSFFQTVGTTPTASWSTFESGAFIRDRWSPVPGLEVVGGLRVMDERLPTTVGVRNSAWEALTGLRNDSIDDRVLQLSPRFELRWDVRNRGRWLVRAGAGMDHDDVSPDLLAELITHDGGIRVRRALGDIGTWPELPDSNVAAVRGPLLALFGPDFAPPRSTRANFGISRLGGTAVHLSGSYRHTDYLPARRDLNLARTPRMLDQYGRPVFGDLEQHGALVGAAPGSNRRFSGFDIVSALESTAFSDYWGATLLLERRLAERVRFAASYTFSRTRDNWLIDGAGSPTLVPRLSDAANDAQWAEGTSDFDAPHRLSIVGELGLPLPLRPTLGITYRARSGAPFTPSFRDGVDVNGDYASNDPAFIDESIDGMEALLDRWECLRGAAGGFAERNSCRGDALHFVDLRAGFDGRIGTARTRVFADVLNLLEQDIAAPDHALYLIDAERHLEFDPVAGTVLIPLVVNPSFGEPVRPLSTGRVYRIGIEVEL